jgi:hypothetical protein
MASKDNKYNGPNRRVSDRRDSNKDRRDTVRFGDILGRRSGVERRVERSNGG